tara:strand:+ start:75262 stop:76026 length:765 start_codon:yes stop_codon:yes gene_type:complete
MKNTEFVDLGQYDVVHGWNPLYKDIPANDNRFRSFDWNLHRNAPDSFRNETVAGNYNAPVALDHQGHIVPQNELNRILQPIAAAAFNHIPRPNTLALLNTFLTANYPNFNFNHVTDYINQVLIANGAGSHYFIDSTGQDIEDYIGGFFSVITWNPVNICRAPQDSRRGGTPGRTVDQQVINYIDMHRTQVGITLDPNMILPFQDMTGHYTNNQLIAFIAACNTSLTNQNVIGKGYYQFSWKENPIAKTGLIPGA